MNPCDPNKRGGVCRCCGETFTEDRPKSMGAGWLCVPCATGITLPPVNQPTPPPAPPRFAKGRWLPVLAGLLLAVSASGASDAFLDRLALVESGGNARAVGDNGRSLGAYQMTAAAWRDVSRARAGRGAVVWPHSAAFTPAVAREYAREYLRISEARFLAATGRTPTPGQLYAAWNLGHAGFRRRAFDLRRCPAATRRAAEMISRMSTSPTDGARF
jgi:hypothetical protein